MLMVMTLPLMVACGGDDETGPSGDELIQKAIGRWMCTESTDQQGDYEMRGLMVGKEITIYSNGQFTSTAPSFGYSGTYTVNGNTITAKSSAGTFVVTVSVNGDRMTWNGTASNGVKFRYTFVRESSSEDDTKSLPSPF